MKKLLQLICFSILGLCIGENTALADEECITDGDCEVNCVYNANPNCCCHSNKCAPCK